MKIYEIFHRVAGNRYMHGAPERWSLYRAFEVLDKLELLDDIEV